MVGLGSSSRSSRLKRDGHCEWLMEQKPRVASNGFSRWRLLSKRHFPGLCSRMTAVTSRRGVAVEMKEKKREAASPASISRPFSCSFRKCGDGRWRRCRSHLSTLGCTAGGWRVRVCVPSCPTRLIRTCVQGQCSRPCRRPVSLTLMSSVRVCVCVKQLIK